MREPCQRADKAMKHKRLYTNQSYKVSQNWCNPLIWRWDKRNGSPVKKCILWDRDIKSMFLLIVIISVSRKCNLLGVSCLQISSDAKIFFIFYPWHCDQGFIVVIVYYFQIWNKKEPNIICCRVISSHMYIEIPNIIHQDSMNTKIWTWHKYVTKRVLNIIFFISLIVNNILCSSISNRIFMLHFH